jgi:hypothetical protein
MASGKRNPIYPLRMPCCRVYTCMSSVHAHLYDISIFGKVFILLFALWQELSTLEPCKFSEVNIFKMKEILLESCDNFIYTFTTTSWDIMGLQKTLHLLQKFTFMKNALIIFVTQKSYLPRECMTLGVLHQKHKTFSKFRNTQHLLQEDTFTSTKHFQKHIIFEKHSIFSFQIFTSETL